MKESSINELLGLLTTNLVLSGRVGTALSYASAICKARKILGNDISLSELFSPQGIHSCQRSMYAQGLCGNTVSFYMRVLRAIYNKGVNLGICANLTHLFDDVYTGIDSTPKRAVSARIFGMLQELELSGKKNLAFSRDLFLLSFSLQGISFVDLARLRKSNVSGEFLSYRRAKTGGLITVALSGFAREIIDQYASQAQGSPYLLPIIKNPDGNTYLQYKSALRSYNRRLKKLAALAGITDNLTSYVARHTWATTAQQTNVAIGLIKQAMGHSTEEVTQIYLAGYDHSALLRANEKVLMAANVVSHCITGEKKACEAKNENVSHLRSERHFRLQT